MKFCSICGQKAEQGAKFCKRCGTKLTANAASVSEELQNAFAQSPTRRECTKCGTPLECDELFCPVCGTKNYVYLADKTRNGDLLAALHRCSLIKLSLIKTPGTLFIYDDKVFFQSDLPGNNVAIRFDEVANVCKHSAMGAKLCVKIGSNNGKTHVFCLSDDDADFYHYIVDLISDYSFKGALQ